MFLTYLATEKTKVSAIHQGMRAWPMVEIVLPHAACLVDFEARSDGDDRLMKRTLMVTHVAELRTLIKEQCKDFRIHHIDLLSPGSLNRAGGWRVDRLNTMSIVNWQQDGETKSGLSFDLEGGACYQDVPKAHIETVRVKDVVYRDMRDLKPELFR